MKMEKMCLYRVSEGDQENETKIYAYVCLDSFSFQNKYRFIIY